MRRSADMRYLRQEHAVTVLLPPHVASEDDRADVKRLFDAAHEQRFSHSAPEEDCELVSLRVTVIGVVRKPPLARPRRPRRAAAPRPRRVYIEAAGWQDWPSVCAGERCQPGRRSQARLWSTSRGPRRVVEAGDRLRWTTTAT